MKHSPTPWILTETPTHVTVRSANNEVIFHDDKRLLEVLADAKLVSAAPDLLEALQEVVDAADGDGWKQIDPLFTKQRAAIAKARGEK